MRDGALLCATGAVTTNCLVYAPMWCFFKHYRFYIHTRYLVQQYVLLPKHLTKLLKCEFFKGIFRSLAAKMLLFLSSFCLPKCIADAANHTPPPCYCVLFAQTAPGWYSTNISIASWTCATTTYWTPRAEGGTGSPNWPGSTLRFAPTYVYTYHVSASWISRTWNQVVVVLHNDNSRCSYSS